jgi:hypothetical protein
MSSVASSADAASDADRAAANEVLANPPVAATRTRRAGGPRGEPAAVRGENRGVATLEDGYAKEVTSLLLTPYSVAQKLVMDNDDVSFRTALDDLKEVQRTIDSNATAESRLLTSSTTRKRDSS